MQPIIMQGGDHPLSEIERALLTRLLQGVTDVRWETRERWERALHVEERPQDEAMRIAELLGRCGTAARCAAVILSRASNAEIAEVQAIVTRHPHAYVVGFHVISGLEYACELAKYWRAHAAHCAETQAAAT